MKLAAALATKKAAAAKPADKPAEAVRTVEPGAAAAALAQELSPVLPAVLGAVALLGLALWLTQRPVAAVWPPAPGPDPESPGDAAAQEGQYLW